ncbi:MAG: 2,3-bisphosphoglycerate-independent phosphoglycerate mutase [bacterium]
MSKNKIILIIRDGWGYSKQTKGNAIAAANTPFDDYLNSNTNPIILQAHGPAVGLPERFQGSSEVGHMNMGAGRVIKQEVTRVYEILESGEIYKTDKFRQILQHLKNTNANIHLMGLLQNEGVHAHQEHLFYLISFFAKAMPGNRVIVHVFSDGRDTAPRSVCSFLEELEKCLEDHGNASIGTLIGRYYAMDRSNNWNLTAEAYNAICFAKGIKITNMSSAVEHQYKSSKTPDNYPMFDEYLPSLIANEYKGVQRGDVLINYNYRQDRAIQLTQAFVDTSSPIYAQNKNLNQDLHYYGLTQYYDEFSNFLIPAITNFNSSSALVGRVISNAGLRQLRIAETQKFRHVTSFFNGKLTNPFSLEDRIEIPSQYDPSSFATHPEMNAKEVTESVLKKLSDHYPFILINYANCDMVGHTGEFSAAVKAVEVVDKNVEIVSKEAIKNDYAVIITADHGNSEEMIELKTDEIKTSHTLNPVKLHVLSPSSSVHVTNLTGTQAILSDIGTLILRLLHLPIPDEMTSRNLNVSYKN